MDPMNTMLSPTSSTARLIAAMALAFHLGTLHANPVPKADHLVYRVKSGDTLTGLVKRHMQGPRALQQLIKANRFSNINLIFVGQKINVPRDLLKPTLTFAKVTQLNCSTVIEVDGGGAKPIEQGAVLEEGAVLRIPAGCRLALTLEDDSTLRLMSGAVVKLKKLRRNSFDASPEVEVELLDGRMKIDVPRKRISPDAPFRVLTPTSIAGVRGTEFYVSFDAKERKSQVMVDEGVVGVRGLLDVAEKRVEAGQGVTILPNGRSLDVEKILAPPRFVGVEPQPGAQEWSLKFEAVPQAERFMLVTARDANFRAILSEDQPIRAQVLANSLGFQPIFYQWSSKTASGLVGRSADYAVCKAYRRFAQWRCDVPFDVAGLAKPKVSVEKIDASGQVLASLYDPVRAADTNLLMFYGLLSGIYRWRIDHEESVGLQAVMNGQFELVALPSTD